MIIQYPKHALTKTGQVLIGALHWYVTRKETSSFVIFQMNSNDGRGAFSFLIIQYPHLLSFTSIAHNVLACKELQHRFRSRSGFLPHGFY
jgi:hypothetical protein